MVVHPASAPHNQDGDPSGSSLKLTQLREEIDAIDVGIHELLIRRASIVAEIRQAKKGGPALRPGREAQILRRLAKRHAPHARGGIGLASILRIWRELIDSLTAFQATFSLGLVATAGRTAQSDLLRDIVRDHYGSYTPLSLYADADQALTAVQKGTITVGIVPYPTPQQSWWATLPSRYSSLSIVARLPFFVPENHPVRIEDTGFVIAAFPAEPSGADRSLIGISCKGQPPEEDDLAARLAKVWPEALVVARDLKNRALLIEVPGFLEHSKVIPSNILKTLEVPLDSVHILGSYAVPLYDDPQGNLG